VINANTKPNIRGILNNIRQFITQQTRSNGIAVINANIKRNITETLNDIREFISQQMLKPKVGTTKHNVEEENCS
jgi:2-phosphoglycerate kinase